MSKRSTRRLTSQYNDDFDNLGNRLISNVLADSVLQVEDDVEAIRKKSVIDQISSDLVRFTTSNKRTKSIRGDSVNFRKELEGNARKKSNRSVDEILNDFETSILRATQPIEISDDDEITVLGEKGIWVNKKEAKDWKGSVDLSDYQLLEDSNPKVIKKKNSQSLEYIKEMSIRYLKPPTPPAHGDLIITQEDGVPAKHAPPIIIRQMPERSESQDTIIIHEKPPAKPKPIMSKSIKVKGRRLPPPPRRVIIEKLPEDLSKQKSIMIERWLPYPDQTRKVVLKKATVSEEPEPELRNLIIEWENSNVSIKTKVRYLGVSKMDPDEYIEMHGETLKSAEELPQYVLDIETPNDLELASETKRNSVPRLVGDLEALKLIDLELEGLAEYQKQLEVSKKPKEVVPQQFPNSFPILSCPIGQKCNIDEIFSEMDINQDGFITKEETAMSLLRLNSKYKMSYGADELEIFFAALDRDRKGSIAISDFKDMFKEE